MVAKAGGLQGQGGKGEAVVNYRKPLTTQDLAFSGFPEGKKRGFKNKLLWNSHQVTSIHRTNSSTTCCHNLNIKIFAIFSMVAVGTQVTLHPPHRSQRALLTHWAPTSGCDVQLQIGIRMHNSDFWQPSFDQAVHTFPSQL